MRPELGLGFQQHDGGAGQGHCTGNSQAHHAAAHHRHVRAEVALRLGRRAARKASHQHHIVRLEEGRD